MADAWPRGQPVRTPPPGLTSLPLCLPAEDAPPAQGDDPVEPAAFAAELIARLEKLRRERETMSSLEERLQQIQEEEERDEGEVPGSAPHHPAHPLGLLPAGSLEEDPQVILDEHLSRPLPAPPRSPGPLPAGCGVGKAFLAKQSTKHIHHHYIHHHHAGPKTKEQVEAEAAQRIQCLCPGGVGGGGGDYSSYHKCRGHGKEQPASPAELALGRPVALSRRPSKASEGAAQPNGEGGGRRGGGSPQLPSDGTDRSQNVWQWILESERQSKHKPHSAQGVKKAYATDSSSKTLPGRTHSWGGGGGGGGGGGHARAHHPAHPFIQDPAMPPAPAQHAGPAGGSQAATGGGLQTPQTEAFNIEPSKRQESFCGFPEWKCTSIKSRASNRRDDEDPLPNPRTLQRTATQERQLQVLLQEGGDEFECGAVFEEVWDDGTVLPMYEGKILGKVERMD
ncbi:hypothetical protein ANANG_G00029930 [Anguilla anguilla]|uniref:DIX domain-containing protein n=1 Tax=Anguilla anguilla TaxID=7936 RepID=A0A9D3S3T3_ANGAN|nr:hypothetical protein ANANG_G00029930 [Anguilla anguilla]